LIKPEHPAELIFQLGKLQVFHHPSPEEKAAGITSKMVFWQNTQSGYTYGPFDSVYHTMNHYTWLVAQQKKAEEDEKKSDAQVIYVDFTMKKRIGFDIP
jgi:hypothetical protein